MLILQSRSVAESLIVANKHCTVFDYFPISKTSMGVVSMGTTGYHNIVYNSLVPSLIHPLQDLEQVQKIQDRKFL